jgi:carotenoid cleavage dioxygenase-like enzyme
MRQFPQTPNYLGLNTPLGIEWQAFDLEIEGEIPAEIEGSFFRAVPDPQYPPFHEDDTVLADDGMVHRIQFKGGHVHSAQRYVQTARYCAEREANKRLFGRYRNPYTDLPEVDGVDRTTANTTPIWHGGHLLMAKEDGRPYKVDPETLETIGSWDYGGKLKSLTMTAHPRIDPETGEMFFYGYEADGFCSKTISYCIANADGELVSEQQFEAPYASLLHDFVITKNYVVFPIFPSIADADRCKSGGLHFMHDQQRESWLGIMPRYGKVSEMQWVPGPRGVSGFHHVNAFEDDAGQINVDICLYETVFFDFIRFPSGINKTMPEIEASLSRWTVDPKNLSKGIESRVLGPMGDMPCIRDRDQGRPYKQAWYLCYNPEGGPPMFGGPLGATVNQMMRIDLETGEVNVLLLPPDTAINEPVHVPAANDEHGGWLLAVIDKKIAEDDYRSEVWVLKADDIAASPVARVKLPVRVRPQVHGSWVAAR